MADDERTGRVHRVDIQMRFADTDALGHVNNGSFVLYAETGRLEFLRVLGGAVRSLILAHLAIDFRRQVVYGESMAIETWVERVGTTSVTLLQTIRASGAIAADVRSVVVYFDYVSQRPQPWPAELRTVLEAYSSSPVETTPVETGAARASGGTA
jgi:acyl-CoA thioester hydrolase